MNKRVKNGLSTMLFGAFVLCVMLIILVSFSFIAVSVFFVMDSFGQISGLLILFGVFLIFAFVLGLAINK